MADTTTPNGPFGDVIPTQSGSVQAMDPTYITAQLTLVYTSLGTAPTGPGTGATDVAYYVGIVQKTGGWYNDGTPSGNNAGYWLNRITNDLHGGGSSGGSGGGGAVGLPVNANPNGYLLTPQLGLLEDDFAYRLSLLCVNVLQPLKDKYPNIVVISGFRQTNSGIGQHELGEAVDVQIHNQTPELLYEVADYIQKNLNFDQLVLNYTNIGDGLGWIHVSFSAQSLRSQVLTKDFADTFHDGLFLVEPLTGEAAAAALRDQATSDALILSELQNIQTRQTRQGQQPTAVAIATAATDSGSSGGSSGLGPEVLARAPGVIYPLGTSWSQALPDTAARMMGDLLVQGVFGQPNADQLVAAFPSSGACYYDKGGGKELYAVTGFYTTLEVSSGAWELIAH
jgi:zinc D-Ala-D-Ala carboxypeptidase